MGIIEAMDPKLKKMSFGKNATLQDAISSCLAGAMGVAFCVDDDGVLLGLLTQGDILRTLQEGASLTSPAVEFLNTNPITVPDSMPVAEAKARLGKRIQFVPRVNAKGQFVGSIDLSSSEYGFINIKQKSVLILGLGYVGLTLGLIMADAGFSVNGYDINKNLLETLKGKRTPFFEHGLKELLDEHVDRRLRLISDIRESASDIFIVTVGTPVDPITKLPVTDYIKRAATEIGSVLSPDNLVILRSTVMVGTTRNVVVPELERVSGLKAGRDFHVAYCPERTAEGRALEELKYLPQIVGGLDEKSIEMASRLFNEHTPTIVNVHSLEAGEMCKLLDNVYRDVKFAFSNQLADVCERLGLNIHELIDAVNHHYGRNDIPKPSPGVGGPCLTKDPYILKRVFEENGMEAPLIAAARRVNEESARSIVGKVEARLNCVGKSLKGARVLVVGLAFKGEPETSDLRDSTALLTLDELKKVTGDIAGYDPVAFPEEMADLGIEVTSLEKGFAGADAVFVLNNHRSYLKWNLCPLLSSMNLPGLFFDAWHMFSEHKVCESPDVLYASIGVGKQANNDETELGASS
jgi:UDP-N-acetyl-D-mannosaminuronic acid dehydrogenase